MSKLPCCIFRVKTAVTNIPLLGSVRVTASDKGITAVEFVKKKICNRNNGTAKRDPAALLNKAIKELRLYAEGRLKRFSVPVSLPTLSAFTKRVLEEVQKIPYGTTISYKQLASAIGRKRASRAVGNSLGENPVPIIIPCHRVVRADGSMGGYSSGTEKKKRLLTIEGVKKN